MQHSGRIRPGPFPVAVVPGAATRRRGEHEGTRLPPRTLHVNRIVAADALAANENRRAQRIRNATQRYDPSLLVMSPPPASAYLTSLIEGAYALMEDDLVPSTKRDRAHVTRWAVSSPSTCSLW
jgi:hypothetical protein